MHMLYAVPIVFKQKKFVASAEYFELTVFK